MTANVRILVVGAGPAAAALGERLRGPGHQVCAVAAPGEAVAQAVALGPDLVVADLGADPGRAGVEAAERCGVPVVCLVDEAGAGTEGPAPAPKVPFSFVAGPAAAWSLRLGIDAALAAQARERALRDEAAGLRRQVARLERDAAISRIVFDAIHQPVVAVDPRGRILRVNVAARSVVGNAPARHDAVFGGYGMFRMDGSTPFPPEELPLARALRGESTTDVEMRVRRPGQTAANVYVSVSGRPLRDGGGDLIGAVVVINNVTRIKETEQRLRAAIDDLGRERRLMEAVLDAMHEGVLAIDLDGRPLLLNRSARSLGGLASGSFRADDEFLRQWDFRVPDGGPFQPDDLPLRRALRGETFVGVEMVLPHPERPEGRHVSVSGCPLPDDAGAVRAGVCVIHDISDVRRREIELRKTAAALQAHARLMDLVFENMSDGVVVADEEGRFTLFNRTAQRLAGIGPTDAGTDEWPAYYGLFHADRVTPFTEQELPLVRAIRGEASDNVEMFVRNHRVPDGIFLSVDGRPLRNEAGDVAGGVAVARDLSQRIAAKEAFASGRLEVLDTILHNLGNAVNSISVGAGALHAELQGDTLIRRLSALADAFEPHRDDPGRWLRDDPRGRKAVPLLLALARDLAARNESLLATAERVRGRVRYVVNLIRVQGALPVSRPVQRIVDLPRQIDEAVAVLREPLAERGIRVDIDCGRAPERIRIHESRFQQMLVSLVRNAMEAIDGRAAAGGFAPDEAPSIRVAAYLDAEHLLIDVIDNGAGIAPRHLRSIFSPGYTTKEAGRGLGLHTAANFVIGMGGRISPFSEGPGRGATLRVMLRRSTNVPESPETAAPDGE